MILHGLPLRHHPSGLIRRTTTRPSHTLLSLLLLLSPTIPQLPSAHRPTSLSPSSDHPPYPLDFAATHSKHGEMKTFRYIFASKCRNTAPSHLLRSATRRKACICTWHFTAFVRVSFSIDTPERWAGAYLWFLWCESTMRGYMGFYLGKTCCRLLCTTPMCTFIYSASTAQYNYLQEIPNFRFVNNQVMVVFVRQTC
jgi:hypothetical protein